MNRYLQDNFAPVTEELTVLDLAVTGRIPSVLRRPLPAHRPEPRHLDRPGRLPLVPRRRHGARRPARGRPRRVVPQPLGPLAEQWRAARRGMARRAPWSRLRLPPQHQRPRARRPTPSPSSRPARRPYRARPTSSTPSGPATRGTLKGGYTAHPHEDPATGELHAVPYNWAPRQPRRLLRHRHRRPGPIMILDAETDMEVVGEAGDGREAIDRVALVPPGRRADGHPDAGARRARSGAVDHLRKRRRGAEDPHAHDLRPRRVRLRGAARGSERLPAQGHPARAARRRDPRRRAGRRAPRRRRSRAA